MGGSVCDSVLCLAHTGILQISPPDNAGDGGGSVGGHSEGKRTEVEDMRDTSNELGLVEESVSQEEIASGTEGL